jgi:lipopolysaccharide transport system ATP-binding protein
MSSSIIKVENISKEFVIAHETQEKYISLRDTITHKAKRIFSFNGQGQKKVTRETFHALKDVSFEIQQGDRVGIIGRNGAGKSTLLKVLSRITEPSSGKITINGRVASLLEVGTGFHPELTGRENIFLNGAILGMSRVDIRKRFDEIVAFAEVEKFLDTPVKRYSSGMYVRLAFAVAAHLDPEILIIDEVLAVGDAQFQKKCLGKMEDVSKNEGRTVLFVSHNMGVITQLCKKAILLKGGQIIANDLTYNVIDQYLFIDKQESAAKYEAESNKRNSEIYFSSILIENEKGENTDQFSFFESVVVKISVQVNKKYAGMKIGFNVQNNYGVYVSTSIQDVDPDSLIEGSLLSFKVTIPSSIIAPNKYSFRFALFSGGNIFDVIENVCQFKINDTGTDLSVYEGVDYGTVILQYQWQKLS